MTNLIDTSAWVRVLPPVRFELSLDPDELRRRRVLKVLDGLPLAPISDDDFETAGDIYRATRAVGHTPRVLIDCIIAAVAIRNRSQLIHNDVDFDRMAEAVDTLSVVRLPNS